MVVPMCVYMVVMPMCLMAVLMAVVPQLGLGQQKEKHDANQQRGEQMLGIGPAGKRLGQ